MFLPLNPDEETCDMSEKNFWETVEADAEAFSSLTKEAGSELSGLIRQHNEIKKKLAAADAQVKDLKQKRQRYVADLIPSLMNEMSIEAAEADGSKVSLTTYASGTMSKDPLILNQQLDHLRDVGEEEFIQRVITVRCPRGQDNKAGALVVELEENGFDVTDDVTVLNPTLRKIFRTRIEKGEPIDLELFNANVGQIAKIT